MEKRKLSKLKKLTATLEMIQLANTDIPEQRQEFGRIEYIYKYGLYIMAEVEEKILKVALFSPNHLALNATDPVYSLFLDRESHDFLSYDHLCKKWRTSVIDRLKYPCAVYYSEVYCDDASIKCIQQYLETDRKAFEAVQAFQLGVRRNNLLKRHSAMTDQWDRVMKKVPKLPKEWEQWIKKVGFTQNFIFYEYKPEGHYARILYLV